MEQIDVTLELPPVYVEGTDMCHNTYEPPNCDVAQIELNAAASKATVGSKSSDGTQEVLQGKKTRSENNTQKPHNSRYNLRSRDSQYTVEDTNISKRSGRAYGNQGGV